MGTKNREPSVAAERPQDVFAQFDNNGDGFLDRAEVANMAQQLGYDVDPQWLDRVMGMYGRNDRNADGSHMIELEEFPQLWDQLGGAAFATPDTGDGVGDKAPAPAEAATSHGSEAAALVFRRYDINGDGVLDSTEIASMVEALGFDADQNYVEDIMGKFGRFDRNADGVVQVKLLRV